MQRVPAFLLALTFAAGAAALPAVAQTSPTGIQGGQQGGQQAGQEQGRGRDFVQRFHEANTTHDGKLTLQQAQAANLKMIVNHFSEIDTQNRGYVTLPELRAYAKQMRAEHHGGGPGGAGGGAPGGGPQTN